MPFSVDGVHKPCYVRLGIRMLDSIVVGVTENTRRLRSFGIVATCALLDILSGQVGMATAAAPVSAANGKSRDSMTRRKRAAQSL